MREMSLAWYRERYPVFIVVTWTDVSRDPARTKTAFEEGSTWKFP